MSFFKDPTVQIVSGYFPKLTTIILAVVCFALGMVWAYGISPTTFVDSEPSQLEQTWQNEWVLGLAGRYANRSAVTDERILQLLEQVDNPGQIVNDWLQLPQDSPYYTPEVAFLQNQDFINLVQQAQANAKRPPARPGIVNNIVMPIVVLVVFVIVFSIGKVLWTLLIFPFIEPLIAKGRDKSDSSEEIARIKQQRAMETAMKEAVVDTTRYGSPIIQRASLFKSGFGNYDDSFNIETPDNLYYGEAGATISETIGEKGVTAIEFWMFDKDAFATTPTAIFASTYAFNDPGIKSRLEPKGEVIEMVPGAKAILETEALYVEATIQAVEYDASAEIPNSVIDNSTIQVIAWAKSGGSGGSGGSALPAPVMPSPMPAQQTPLTPPSFSGGEETTPMGGAQPKPLTPPSFGSNKPDDPFGGTGDFTPVNPNE